MHVMKCDGQTENILDVECHYFDCITKYKCLYCVCSTFQFCIKLLVIREVRHAWIMG